MEIRFKYEKIDLIVNYLVGFIVMMFGCLATIGVVGVLNYNLKKRLYKI